MFYFFKWFWNVQQVYFASFLVSIFFIIKLLTRKSNFKFSNSWIVKSNIYNYFKYTNVFQQMWSKFLNILKLFSCLKYDQWLYIFVIRIGNLFLPWIDFDIDCHNYILFTELDNADLYVPVDPNKIPKFLNKPSTYQVVTKDTIVLPCEVYNPGKI